MAFMNDVISSSGKGTLEWGITNIPQFKGLKALVLAGAFYREVVVLMAEAGFERAASVEDADVVVFTGGADINPALYGQKALSSTSFSEARDKYEQEIYHQCVKLEKVMFGICRGMQFLAAMNGCELWQHVENHAGGSHWIYDIDEDVRVMATSVHHQMVMPNDDMDIIAVTEEQVSRIFMNEDLFIDLNKEGNNAPHELELEACAFHKTKCFMVQGHPEIGTPAYRSWTLTSLKVLMELWEQQDNEATEEELTERVVG